jgi:hypothetical protein
MRRDRQGFNFRVAAITFVIERVTSMQRYGEWAGKVFGEM